LRHGSQGEIPARKTLRSRFYLFTFGLGKSLHVHRLDLSGPASSSFLNAPLWAARVEQ
jgi:hypothetical protein